MLHPINKASLDDVLQLLLRGFPAHDASFWRAGIDRLQQHHERHGFGPIGYLTGPAGARTGVALTMVSERLQRDGTRRRVVNLSSWYVEERARFLAPLMLKQLTADQATIFTDLTPNESVRKLIVGTGFMPWSGGLSVALLPLVALLGGGRAAVLSGAALASADLTEGQRLIVDDHARMGCLTAGLMDGKGISPLVFLATRRRGLPTVRLIYAESRRMLLAELGAVARHLLRHGFIFAEIPVDAADRVPGGWFTTGAPPTFYKGALAPDMIDHAWSEFVFLRL